MIMELPYRLGVGIVLFNKVGKVWLGKRIIKDSCTAEKFSWQFPQGGVNENENLELAARRELYEETCIKNIELLGKYEQATFYNFPKNLQHLNICKNYKGQKQYWFAYLFTGQDSGICTIDVPTGSVPEFNEWKWADFNQCLDLIVDFKKETYKSVYDFFKKYEVQIKNTKI